MAWDHTVSKSADKMAARLVSESTTMLKLIKDNEKKAPAYVSKLLGVEVTEILMKASSEINAEIGDRENRSDLGWKDKVGRKKALQDVAYAVKRELKSAGVNTRLLDNRAAKKGINAAVKGFGESYGMDDVEKDRVRNLSSGLHKMTISDTKLTDVEKMLGGFASVSSKNLQGMSDEELTSRGYYRVPAFTRGDGTKVRSHIRRLSIA